MLSRAVSLVLRRSIMKMPILFRSNIGKYAQISQIPTYGGFATMKPKDPEDDKYDFDEEQSKDLGANAYQTIISYPFSKIPTSLIRSPQVYNIDEQLKKQLIAFKALSLRGEFVQMAGKLILSPTDQELLQEQEEDKKKYRVFDYYFADNLDNMINMINQAKGSLEDRIKAMKIINYVSSYFFVQEAHPKLNQSAIVKQDPSGVLMAYYIRFASKYNEDYNHLLPVLEQKMTLENDPEAKLNLARAVLSTVNCRDCYPAKTIDDATQIYIDNIKKVSNFQIIQTLRFLYNIESKVARKYGQIMIKHLMGNQISQGNIDNYIPLILKTIKYCNKHKLSSNELVEFVMQNMNKFKVIFQNKNLSKGLLFSLIFQKRNKNTCTEEVLEFLKQFFFSTIKQLSTAQQIQEGQLVRVSKLLIKYMDLLSASEKQHIREEYLRYIIPQFNSSDQVLYYSLLVVLREPRSVPEESTKLAQYERNTELIKKMSIKYLRSISQQRDGKLIVNKFINTAIELLYQLNRHDIHISQDQLPSILQYDYSVKKTVEPETVGYFFTYLIKSNTKPKDLHRILTQMTYILEVYLRSNKIRSMKTLFTILDVCDRAEFDHEYFYKNFEKCFANFLTFNPNYFILEKDIKFLNSKLIKRGYGSNNLRKFITSALQNPKNWPRARQEYVNRQERHRDQAKNTKKRY